MTVRLPRWRSLWATTGALSIPLALAFIAAAPKGTQAKATLVDRNTCYSCHEEVKALKEGSKHAKLACETCHDALAKHIDSHGEVKPITKLDPALCGGCHKAQYQSFFTVSSEGGARKEKGNLPHPASQFWLVAPG
jgi:uncharacterized CHY-type Zn-finger protein